MAPRAAGHADVQDVTAGRALKRRGILAAAGAVVAGFVAKQTSQPVEAGIDGDVVAAGLTVVAAATGLRNNLGGNFVTPTLTCMRGPDNQFPPPGNYVANVALVADSKSSSDAIGVWALGDTAILADGGGAGVQAYAGAATSIAVLGQADPAGAIGAIGKSSAGVGIKGVSDTGFPIIGQAVALWSTNPGTLGVGTAGPGVQGQSAAGHGLIGYTSASDGHAALIGYAQAAGGVGLIGVAPGSAGHWAGVFYGDVHINGTTSAPVHTTVVKHAGDNTSRALYSTISPESWVEDFGNGTLAGGKANIALDADFAALVDTRTMHLFMTAHGPHYLHVEQQTVAGFTVVATAIGSGQAGGPKPAEGGGTFSWRVVAKRKDIVGERLAKVPPPPLKSMTPITVPETPAVKPPPRRPSE